MAYKQKPELNEDAILEYLRDAVSRIRSEEDPIELNTYRRLFRKGVPFTLRSYFAAYVLKQLDNGSFAPSSARQGRRDKKERPSRDESAGREVRSSPKESRDGREQRKAAPSRPETSQAKGERQERDRGDEAKRERQAESRNRSAESRQAESRQAENRPAESRPSLPEEGSTTLFISVGRNRRVYPRDLIGLILQTAEIDREHIGEIRVLDNYSFVQVIADDAEKIIASLNESEYRGRKLTVSYSKKREEAAAAPSDDADSRLEKPGVDGGDFTETPYDDDDSGSFDIDSDGGELQPESDSEGDPSGLADSEEDRGEVN